MVSVRILRRLRQGRLVWVRLCVHTSAGAPGGESVGQQDGKRSIDLGDPGATPTQDGREIGAQMLVNPSPC